MGLIVFDLRLARAQKCSNAVELVAHAKCPIVVVAGFPPADTRLTLQLSAERPDAVFPVNADDLRRLVVDLLAGVGQQSATAAIISAVSRPLPPIVDKYRIACAILARHNTTCGAVSAACHCSTSGVRSAAARLALPSPGLQLRYAVALHMIHSVLEVGLGEKQVAAIGGFGSASNVSHRISETTGLTIREWKYQGGFGRALAGYAALWI